MSVLEFIVRLVALALLGSYLFIKRRQRVHNWSEPEDPAKWTGRTIDATKLTPTVGRVRQDYLAARQPPARSIGHRRGLLALAGQAVGRLPIFRNRKSEDDAHKHVT